jgi:hypothetical protein
MNNTIILDHTCLFTYINIEYPSSYHYVSILWHFTFYNEWRQYFIHEDNYFEVLLEDFNYTGEEMFIMIRIERREVAPNSNLDAI